MKNKLKTVKWLDARELTIGKEDTDRLLNSDGLDYLIVKQTYGIVYELENVVLVATETNSDGETEFTVIPNTWLLDIV